MNNEKAKDFFMKYMDMKGNVTSYNFQNMDELFSMMNEYANLASPTPDIEKLRDEYKKAYYKIMGYHVVFGLDDEGHESNGARLFNFFKLRLSSSLVQGGEKEWISVKDRLPAHPKGEVLIYREGDDKTFVGLIWKSSDGRYYGETAFRQYEGITHWQPLQPAPKNNS